MRPLGLRWRFSGDPPAAGQPLRGSLCGDPRTAGSVQWARPSGFAFSSSLMALASGLHTPAVRDANEFVPQSPVSHSPQGEDGAEDVSSGHGGRCKVVLG